MQPWPRGAWENLERLLRPVHDALDFTGARGWTRTGVVTLLMREMHDRDASFWAWSRDEWLTISTPDSPTFIRRHRRNDKHRLNLLALAYLLWDFQDLDAIGRYIPRALAYKVFGRQDVDDAVDRVCQELFRWGYGRSKGRRKIPHVVCLALLHDRSPLLEELCTPVMAHVRAHVSRNDLKVIAVHVSRALTNLGCIDLRLRSSVNRDRTWTTSIEREVYRPSGSGGVNDGGKHLHTRHAYAIRIFRGGSQLSVRTLPLRPAGRVRRRPSGLLPSTACRLAIGPPHTLTDDHRDATSRCCQEQRRST